MLSVDLFGHIDRDELVVRLPKTGRLARIAPDDNDVPWVLHGTEVLAVLAVALGVGVANAGPPSGANALVRVQNGFVGVEKLFGVRLHGMREDAVFTGRCNAVARNRTGVREGDCAARWFLQFTLLRGCSSDLASVSTDTHEGPIWLTLDSTALRARALCLQPPVPRIVCVGEGAGASAKKLVARVYTGVGVDLEFHEHPQERVHVAVNEGGVSTAFTASRQVEVDARRPCRPWVVRTRPREPTLGSTRGSGPGSLPKEYTLCVPPWGFKEVARTETTITYTAEVGMGRHKDTTFDRSNGAVLSVTQRRTL